MKTPASFAIQHRWNKMQGFAGQLEQSRLRLASFVSSIEGGRLFTAYVAQDDILRVNIYKPNSINPISTIMLGRIDPTLLAIGGSRSSFVLNGQSYAPRLSYLSNLHTAGNGTYELEATVTTVYFYC